MQNKRPLIVVSLLFAFLLQGKVFGESAEECFNRGHKFYLESKPVESEAEFKKALSLNPRLGDAHYYLGSIYFKQERYSETIEQCKQALRISPEDLKSLIILGLAFQQLGLTEDAINTLQKASILDSQSAAACSALGLAYCAIGDLKRAQEQYNRLLQIDPELADDLLQKISEKTIPSF